MVRAYVTIVTMGGSSRELLASIRDLDGILQADIVAGEFDIMAEVEADSESDLLTLITEEIRPLEGVGRTSTLVVLE